VLIDAHSSFMKRHQVRRALNGADVVTCDGENTTKALTELMGGSDRIRKIYFGVDTKKNSPEKRTEGFYGKYLKGGRGKVVINIRGFNKVYDPDSFIKAIPPVLEKQPDTVFIMAREGEGRKPYEEIVKSLGIADSVKFIGNISADDLPAYLSSADVYVSTSISDSGISASTAEAMANGAAVISTDVGDASYWIDDGKNGMIIPKGDSRALSEKILYLISNDGVRKSMGREARITIETRQDYYKEMGRVEALYESLIKEVPK
jgi:glycosyltransferase involved in cell wall biosynthesis